MPPNIKRKANVIVLDIGSRMAETGQNGSTHIKNAKRCIRRFLIREFFSHDNNNFIALVICGSDVTSSEAYPNVEKKFPLRTLYDSWDLCKFIETDSATTNRLGDSMDGLIVAMDILYNDIDPSLTITEKNIILVTKFQTEMILEENQEYLNATIQGLNSMEINLAVIGPDVLTTDWKAISCENASQNLKKLESLTDCQPKLIQFLLQIKQSSLMTFPYANACLRYHVPAKPYKKISTWSVVLDIGCKLEIPVTGYKLIAPVPKNSWRTVSNKEGNEGSKLFRTTVPATGNAVPATGVAGYSVTIMPDDVISGFKFGDKIIPVPRTDQEQMFKSGKKCLSVFGFARQKKIGIELFAGKGCYYFQARSGNQMAAKLFNSLLLALDKSKRCCLVRKVYGNDGKLLYGALLPSLQKQALIFVQLSWYDDIRQFLFTPLFNAPLTKDQLNCIDNLIDTMDEKQLSKQDSQSQLFNPTRTGIYEKLNPSLNHYYNSIYWKALNPEAPMLAVEPDTKLIMDCPFESDQEVLKRVKHNYHLAKYEQVSKKTANNIFKRSCVEEPKDETSINGNATSSKATSLRAEMTMAAMTTKSVLKISTIKPVEDFNTLIDNGSQFSDVAKEMGRIITSLIMDSFQTDNYSKAITALEALRGRSITLKTLTLYDGIIADLKKTIFEIPSKKDFWDLVLNSKLDFISKVNDMPKYEEELSFDDLIMDM